MAALVDARSKRSFALPDSRWGAELFAALKSGRGDAVHRAVRALACMAPETPALAALVTQLSRTGHLETSAALARMAVCLDAGDGLRHTERMQRGLQALRADLLPPHWLRDALAAANRLQALIQEPDLAAARDYATRPDLAGSRRYMPRFRALKHFALYNHDPAYRSAFAASCIRIHRLPAAAGGGAEGAGRQVLEDFKRIARWTTPRDTVTALRSLDGYPIDADKRMRSSRLAPTEFIGALSVWGDTVLTHFADYWKDLAASPLFEDMFGIPRERARDVDIRKTVHINEILGGPVLGPHYHSGYDLASEESPLLSGVYYPEEVPESDSRAGYLEIGRPDFHTAFEPDRVYIRPLAGTLVLFPAFAYHSVVPIERSPRYSVNLDVFVRPKGAATFSVSEFAA